MLGLSRQYVGQLVKRPKPGPAIVFPAPTIASAPKEVPPVTVTPPAAPPPAVPEAPKGDGAPTLKSILDAAGAGSPGYVPEAGGAPPVAPPPPAPGAPQASYDPEDAEAARALIAEGQQALGETIAVYAYGMKADDPRLKGFQETNAFLKIALKRNDENIAVVGKLTKGLPGLAIGAFLEILRVARVVRSFDKGPAEETPLRPAASPASSPGTVADEPGDADEGGGGEPRFSIARAAAAAAAKSAGAEVQELERPDDDDEPEPARFSITQAKMNARS